MSDDTKKGSKHDEFKKPKVKTKDVTATKPDKKKN